jgi:hypothetical protein
MIAAVKSIAAERCQVDTPNKRDLVVHDDELLVVAMHRALVEIKRALHARAADELLAHLAHGRTSRREDRQWRSPPQQHPDLDSLGQITEQIAQSSRLIVARQPEIRGDVPPGDMDMRASAPQRRGDARQRLPTVNQHVKRAPRARRRIAGSPQRWAVRGVELIDPANPPQPAAMMRTDCGLDALTGPPIHTLNQATRHPQSLPAGPRVEALAGSPASSRYRSKPVSIS